MVWRLSCCFFALGQRNFGFGAAVEPVQRERHERVALAFDQADQAADFPLVQQQFALAQRVGEDMGGGGLQRRQMGADQEQLAAVDGDVAFFELDAAGAQAFDFPALQYDAGFELLLDGVVKARFAIIRNRVVGRLFLLGHWARCGWVRLGNRRG